MNQIQAHYVDLEAPSDQQRLQNPELLLTSVSGLVILDEIQLAPKIFSILWALVDRPEPTVVLNPIFYCLSKGKDMVWNLCRSR